MKSVCTIGIAGALCVGTILGAGPASAQESLSIGTMPCKTFVESPKETIGIILTWIIGHYHDENEPLVIDFKKMEEVGGKLGRYCGRNPSHSMQKAIDEVLE